VIAYVDSSVLLRMVLHQPGRLEAWSSIRRPVSSSLLRVECFRTLENYRQRVSISDEDLAVRRAAVLHLLAACELVHPDPIVLDRASLPMPTRLNTLDAIHLATALVWQDARGERAVMATHDRALGAAAHAFGMDVIGLT
jgi:predicted nucleic acid-binding protein